MESLTELYCLMADFCKVFEPILDKKALNTDVKKRRKRSCSLSLAELMTLVVLFHQLRFRQFKIFYLHYVCVHLRCEFPKLPSYQRVISLMPRTMLALTALFDQLKGECTGISIADSTPITVCDNLRIKRHRVFSDSAERGKSSTGWFFGFKLHVIINHCGELTHIKLTKGNVDDRKALKDMLSDPDSVFGKLFADKGYLSQKLSETLANQNIQLITKVRKNMKSKSLDPFDAAILKKRSIIETVFDELKNLCQIEHSRHRSVNNFAVNLMAGIIAYCLFPQKPALNLSISAIKKAKC
jgi:transposase